MFIALVDPFCESEVETILYCLIFPPKTLKCFNPCKYSIYEEVDYDNYTLLVCFIFYKKNKMR